MVVIREPTSEEISKLYDGLFHTGGYDAHRLEFERLKAGRAVRDTYRRHILKRLEGSHPGRRLVEIGGGTGAFGVMARSRGWQYTDWDISDVAVNCARALSLDAQRFDAGSAPPLSRNSADVIVMWEVIEHLWKVREYLEVIREALVPGGVFVASTPNLRRTEYLESLTHGPSLSAPPLHVNFFTADSLANAVQSVGFARVEIVQRRFHRPQPTLRSLVNTLSIAVGRSEAKSLYCWAWR